MTIYVKCRWWELAYYLMVGAVGLSMMLIAAFGICRWCKP